MTIRARECRRFRQKGEWRGGRVCVWHDSVCLCHPGSGLFSPLPCLDDANRPNLNLAFTPTRILTQFCLILLLKVRPWRTARGGEQSRRTGGRNEEVETRKLAESQTVWLRRDESRAGWGGDKKTQLSKRGKRTREGKGLWGVHINVINQKSWFPLLTADC